MSTGGRGGGSRLIALVGLDGSGKTTLARWLQSQLERNGDRAVYVHVWPSVPWARRGSGPGERSKGERLSRWRAYGLYALALWFLNVRLPWLLRVRRPSWVVCDRYFVDLAAYLALRGWSALGQRLLQRAKRLEPDVILWLRGRPEQLLKRKPRLEGSLKTYRAWDALYAELLPLSIAPERLSFINADAPLEAVQRQAVKALRDRGLLPSFTQNP